MENSAQLYRKLHLFGSCCRSGLKRPTHFSKRLPDVLAPRSVSQFSEAIEHLGAVTHFENRIELAFAEFKNCEESIARIAQAGFEDSSGTVNTMLKAFRTGEEDAATVVIQPAAQSKMLLCSCSLTSKVPCIQCGVSALSRPGDIACICTQPRQFGFTQGRVLFLCHDRSPLRATGGHSCSRPATSRPDHVQIMHGDIAVILVLAITNQKTWH